MECTIREFDQMIIRGLKSSDPEVHSRCVYRIFYEDAKPLLSSIQFALFKGTIEYDELVNELYLYLSRNGWRILDSFQGRNGARLSTWLSHVSWHFFMNYYRKGNRVDYLDDLGVFDRQVSTISIDEMRMDIERTLSKMSNERYVSVIRLLIIEGRETEAVAKMLDTSIQNVYNLKHRAIASFIELYQVDIRVQR